MYRFVMLALLVPVSALAAPDPIPDPNGGPVFPPPLPDLRIASVTPSCGYNYVRQVTVGVTNAGDVATPSTTWLDVFEGRAEPPAVGELSSIFVNVGAIPARTTWYFSFDLPGVPYVTWIDVIADTVRGVLESSESNNSGYAWADYGDCAPP